MHLPNPNLVIDNLKEIDLTNLQIINFKGGEPMLNSETFAILNYLNDISVLPKLNLYFSTNGTVLPDEILFLLSKAKQVLVNVSIDGTDELFNYIRYGSAKFETIEPVIAKYNQLNNVRIVSNTAVMNYNIFNLLDINKYIKELSIKYDKLHPSSNFSNCVNDPDCLSILTLSDPTREFLINFYKENNKTGDFNIVISTLQNKYLGDQVKRKWIEYTNLMEEVRKNNIISIVPQLESEMK
jgi:hypothetical protein